MSVSILCSRASTAPCGRAPHFSSRSRVATPTAGAAADNASAAASHGRGPMALGLVVPPVDRWRRALVIVKPATVIAWHRRGLRLYSGPGRAAAVPGGVEKEPARPNRNPRGRLNCFTAPSSTEMAFSVAIGRRSLRTPWVRSFESSIAQCKFGYVPPPLRPGRIRLTAVAYSNARCVTSSGRRRDPVRVRVSRSAARDACPPRAAERNCSPEPPLSPMRPSAPAARACCDGCGLGAETHSSVQPTVVDH